MMETQSKFLKSGDYDRIILELLNESENRLGLLCDIFKIQKGRNPDFICLMQNAIDRRKQQIYSKYIEVIKYNPTFQPAELNPLLSLEDGLLALEATAIEVNEKPEPPRKFEKLLPIEKILIMYYLKIDLTSYQMGLKPGKYFLSNLLDINPESIKNPLIKLPDYTTNNKLTESQARNLYPTLEKIKRFFDESELFKTSKLIEERIKQLRLISGKD